MAERPPRTGRGAPRYDPTTKYLFDRNPAFWLAVGGRPPGGPVRALETDLSTVQAAVDKVARVDEAVPWLAHVEFQSSRDRHLASRLLQYNALLQHRHRLRVETIVVLLRPAADLRSLAGVFRQARPDGSVQLEFHYTVVRVWEQPVEALLGGDLTGLPLAPLARVGAEKLPAIVRRVDERLRVEAAPAEAERLWMATYWLAGLRYTETIIEPLFGGVRAVRDSATYQAAVAEGEAKGRAEGARELLLRQGELRFGPPNARTRRALRAIGDFERLERLGERLLQAASWDDLLATP